MINCYWHIFGYNGMPVEAAWPGGKAAPGSMRRSLSPVGHHSLPCGVLSGKRLPRLPLLRCSVGECLTSHENICIPIHACIHSRIHTNKDVYSYTERLLLRGVSKHLITNRTLCYGKVGILGFKFISFWYSQLPFAQYFEVKFLFQ